METTGWKTNSPIYMFIMALFSAVALTYFATYVFYSEGYWWLAVLTFLPLFIGTINLVHRASCWIYPNWFNESFKELYPPPKWLKELNQR